MELEIRHLRVLLAIADNGSISRAAAALRMSQPALAAQLRRIERKVGGSLFERGRDGVRSTPLGRWLLDRSRSLLPAFDELERSTVRYADLGRERSRIRVGCAPTRLASHVANSFYLLAPDADVHIRSEQTSDMLVRLLASERIELALLDDYPDHELAGPSGNVYGPIAVEPLFVGMAPGHPLAAHEEVRLGDLADEAWSLPSLVEAGPWGHFWQACGEHGFEPRVPYCVHVDVAVDLIAADRCVGLFQASSPDREGIVIRPLAGAPLRFRHLIGWKERGPVAAMAGSLVEAVAEAYWAEAKRAPIYRDWLARHGRLPSFARYSVTL